MADIEHFKDIYAEAMAAGYHTRDYYLRAIQEAGEEFDELIREIREHAFNQGALATYHMHGGGLPGNPHKGLPLDPTPWRYALVEAVNRAREATQVTGGFVFDPREGFEQELERYER